jgi:hypothetical protein
VTKKHHIENIWNYQNFGGVVDFLNNVDPAFPDSRIKERRRRFVSRTRPVGAGRSRTILSTKPVTGIVGGTVLFFLPMNAGQFANQAANGQAINQGIGGFSSITSATVPLVRSDATVRCANSVTT